MHCMVQLVNKKKIKHIAGDLTYSVLGLIVMNGLIQLALYPFLNKIMGADKFGNVLYILSIVSIIGVTFGSAANYSRMIRSRLCKDNINGDYNRFLIAIAVLAIPVFYVNLQLTNNFHWIDFVMLCLLVGFSVFRYYGDVEFRLTLNFRGYFIYYLLISLGYLVGMLIFKFTGIWLLAILIGEISAFVYVFSYGSIYSKPFLAKSDIFTTNIKSMVVLSCSNFVGAIILNADRIIIRWGIGAEAVTVFYAATLLGKIVALLSTPVNSLIISYLTKYGDRLSKKQFAIIAGAMAVLGILCVALCTIVSHIFLRLMYENVYLQTKPYLMIAIAGQIFYFLSSILMVIILRYSSEKLQVYINLVYLTVFLAVVLPATLIWNLMGIAVAILVVNLLKFIGIFIIGCGVFHVQGTDIEQNNN